MYADPSASPSVLILDILYAMGAVPGYGRSIPTPRLRRLLACVLGRPVSMPSLRYWCDALRDRVDIEWTHSRSDPLRYTRVGARCRGYWYILAPGEAPPTPGL